MTLEKTIEKYKWYLARLRLMSVREVLFRAGRAASNQLATALPRPAPAAPRPDLRLLPSQTIIPDPSGIDPAPYIRSADELVEGRLRIFERVFTLDGLHPKWNRDPLTGVTAPLSHGKRLDYRDPEKVGDIKYLWELNRHMHMVTLAQAYRFTGQTRYLGTLAAHLRSWLDQCPCHRGANWSSSLEAALRLINWCFTWDLIGGACSDLFAGDEGKKLRDDWLGSVYLHCDFIAGYFSLYSSANNHLIGEAAGLYIASTVWPLWGASPKWHSKGNGILLSEVLRQNCPDGVNREQALAYQHYEMDLLLISALVGQAHGHEFPPFYWDTLERMFEYLASVMDVAGNVPMFGDSDDAMVARLSREEGFCVYRSLLATASVLYKRPDFLAKAGGMDDKTRWLLGSRAEEAWTPLETSPRNLPVRRAFPHGGYYILGTGFETPEEIRLVADAGPLGYLSIAAHGHADALSFVLFCGGREFLIDPGTYAFHTNREWRDYFRGTSAHNTIRIDGEDQSLIGGNFMWLRKAAASCIAWEPGETLDRFIGRHDGYSRLPDPVTHYREIELHKAERRIHVIDIIECGGPHLAEQFWHFSEDCTVTTDGAVIRAENRGAVLTLKPVEGQQDIELLHGSWSPIAGWVSRKLDVKRPTTTVVLRSVISGTARFVVELQCVFPEPKAQR